LALAPALLVASLAAAAVFALHPVHTETVTYILGRSSGLSAFFYLAALFGFVWAGLKSTSAADRTVGYVTVLLAGGTAVLVKETSLTLPLGLLVFDLCLMRGDAWRPRRERLWRLYLPLLIMAAVLILISPTLRGELGNWMGKVDPARIELQLPVWTHALRLLMFPVNLTFDYDFSQGFFQTWTPVATGMVWALLAAAAVWNRRRSPALWTFAFLWFTAALAPTNSILPRLDLFSERNLYLPSIGLCWWAVTQLAILGRDFSPGKWTACLGGLILLLTSYSLLTVHRNDTYKTDVALWQDTVEKSPQKAEVHYYLTLAHYRAGDAAAARRELVRLKEKDPALVEAALTGPEEARQTLESYFTLLQGLSRAARSDPHRFKLYGRVYMELAGLMQGRGNLYHTRLLLGVRHASKGRMRLAEEEFRQAIAARPHLPGAYLNLGVLQARQGKRSLARQSFSKAEERLNMDPDPLPDLLWNRARLEMEDKKLRQAQNLLERYLKTEGSPGRARLLLGRIAAVRGDPSTALEQWSKVTGTPKEEAQAKFSMGMAYLAQNRHAEAKTVFADAVAKNPKLLPARFNLAKLILESGEDRAAARRHLEFILNRTRDPVKRKAVQVLLSRAAQ
ncbi:MAG: tetratricopeptide repeat protein, partial [Nitrospinaceae bacterium]